MRALAVGKEITFTSTHSLPPNNDTPRDIGTAEISGLDLTTELLRSGWGKLKDLKREPTDEDLKRRELEAEAKFAGKGLWNPHGPQVGQHDFLIITECDMHVQARAVHYNPPEDPQVFVTEWKGKLIDGNVLSY